MILEDYRAHFKHQIQDLYPPEEVGAITLVALQHVLKMNRVEISLSRKQNLSLPQKSELDAILERLLKSEPIQYITGSTEFYGLELQVNRATLIPRPETEELVAWILAETPKDKPSSRILDIGTGSGCIAIALAKHLPLAKVEAVDISLPALQTAQANAQGNEVNVDFFQQDILEATELDGTYDIIVSNPPYVRELEKAEIKNNVLQHEPHSALFVTDTNPLLFYKKIAQLAMQHLKPEGTLFFEINEYFGKETVALVKEIGFTAVEMRKDIFGKDRMLRASMLLA